MPVFSPAESKTLRLDDCTVSYQRRGEGTPLLFLHGANNVPGWPPFMARLAERYDVIVPDHPGFGRSEIPPWLDTIHDLAYFYLDFIEALGLHGVHLVGASLGGWIACEIAVRQTAALRTLTLVAPAGLRLAGVRKLDTFLMSPQPLRARSSTIRNSPTRRWRSRRPTRRSRSSSRTATVSLGSPGNRGSSIRTSPSGCTGSIYRPYSYGASKTG